MPKNKIWLWTAVDHFKQEVLGWILGDRSSETFKILWEDISQWKYYFDVADGWKVYPSFISEGAQIVSQTYMTLSTRRKYKNETLSSSITSSNSLLF